MSISFREIEMDDAKMLLDWRTAPEINQYMTTDVPYDIEAQKRWILNSYARNDYYHWIALYDDMPIGSVSINDFDAENERTSWGIYKGVPGFPGVGAKILPLMYNWLFFEIGVREIYTEAVYHNTKAIDLYLRHGHKFMPAKDRVIRKGGREILLLTLSLSIQDWDRDLYKECVAAFPVSHWKCAPACFTRNAAESAREQP